MQSKEERLKKVTEKKSTTSTPLGEAPLKGAKFEWFQGKLIDPFSPNVANKDLRLTKAEGLRFDEGKNRLDLIPPEWEWELGRVLTEGAKKYADRNWELGMDYSKVVGPLRRHLNAYLRGERIDPTDGTLHAAKVAWNALVLMTYDLRKIGKDNVTGEHKS